jgi:predicted RNase H-like HicB family nuclease
MSGIGRAFGFEDAGHLCKEVIMFYTIKAMIYKGEESGFVAECVELPVVTQGATLDDVIHNLREAIALHLEGENLQALGFAANPPILVNFEMEPVYA